ncbi:MAG: DUF4832 domain-containing protein [Ktedonobacteraceae bacterium]|nr:DUF4832 domain-containing protein [Ktedonobacteraceae bacterium]
MVQKFFSDRIRLLSILGAIVVIVAIILIALNISLQKQQQVQTGVQQGKPNLTPTAGGALFTPATIPLSESEVGNPMRGPQYYGEETPPPGWPLSDTYERFCWSAVEKGQGQYDFSRIDAAIARAKAAGYTFSWRIMPVNTDNTACLPQYLKNMMPNGFTADSGAYIPDYNSEAYMSRAQALIQALGQRYDSNPNVGVLDMSLYGCWGEWNESCSGGKGVMTLANRQKLIDMQFQAFPHKRFLMLTAHQDSLNYALSYQRPLRTGVRIDCLGKWELGGAQKGLDQNMLEHNQWKVAPLYFEYCNNPDFSLALEQIKKYHASSIGSGDGNIKSFDQYSPDQQDLLIQNFKAAGYRFELNALTIPKQLSPGATFSVVSQWTNVNTAPAYMPWNVMIQLRSNETTVAWQGKSQLDLQQFYSESGQGGEGRTVTDSFTLPGNIAHGNYNVCVQIVDPAHVYAPLALANKERGADGSYCIGKISVR